MMAQRHMCLELEERISGNGELLPVQAIVNKTVDDASSAVNSVGKYDSFSNSQDLISESVAPLSDDGKK